MSELVLDHFVHSWRGPAVPSVKRTLSVHRLLFTSVLYYYLVHRLIIISRSVRKPSARLRAAAGPLRRGHARCLSRLGHAIRDAPHCAQTPQLCREMRVDTWISGTPHTARVSSAQRTRARARPHTRSSARRKPAALKKCKAYNSTEHTLDALSPLRVPLQAECLVAGMTASPDASPR
jgi:hypothetical protein